MSKKLRILGLHGYRQDGNIFREKTGGFRKYFKKYADFVFMNAPHVLKVFDEGCLEERRATPDEKATGNHKDERGWWFSRENFFSSKDVTDFDFGFQESVEAVVRFMRDEGPFDGIFAFSQGAALAALLAALRFNRGIDFDLKFMILVAGFPSLCSRHAELVSVKIPDVPVLSIYGENDKVVACENSKLLAEMFPNPKSVVITHVNGHMVPTPSALKHALPLIDKFMNSMR
ncbi:hypothetical protein AB6A40_005931 [Gnathostoma spinigerum]|uniref:Serine hydrolase domain-containing protein n=1 Tax=Gnathostoma spinigerum TaxID=75299 RepID=A0ABD6ERP4_9BILA